LNDIQSLQEAVNAVKEHGTITKASKALKIPRKTLSDRCKRAELHGIVAGMPPLSNEHAVVLDSKFAKLLKDKKVVEAKYRALLSAFEDSEQALETIQDFSSIISDATPMQIKQASGKSTSESTAVILCSDIHYEETVDPDTIRGLNRYNTDIAKHRMTKFTQNALKLVDMCRSKSTINNLVLWLGGDLITGYIHEELLETNSMSPVDASTEVFEILIGVIDCLLAEGKFKKIVIPTNVGNHGRTTQRRRVSTAVQNNYEWLVYKFLEKYYKEDDRIQFQLTRGYFNYLDIYGRTLRFHHGDNVRYQGGVGGLTIPLNKAIAKWNEANPVYLDVLGHWHQRLSSKNSIVNGSVIGYNAYAESIKASFEKPQQTFFLMHPKWGKTVEAPIWLE